MLVLSPLLIYAETPTTQNPSGSSSASGLSGVIRNPFKGGDSLMDLVQAILNNIILPIAVVAVVIWIIWAGFQYVLAQGNPGKIEKAHQRLLWSLVGAGILLGAAGIAEVVKNTVNTLIR